MLGCGVVGAGYICGVEVRSGSNAPREQEIPQSDPGRAFGGGPFARWRTKRARNHGDIRARLRDVHPVCAARGQAAEADKTPAPAPGGPAARRSTDLSAQMEESRSASTGDDKDKA